MLCNESQEKETCREDKGALALLSKGKPPGAHSTSPTTPTTLTTTLIREFARPSLENIGRRNLKSNLNASGDARNPLFVDRMACGR